jgi:hypothetical protein
LALALNASPSTLTFAFVFFFVASTHQEGR